MTLLTETSLKAFSLNGPNELPWQVERNGYAPSRLTGPMNIDAEYRWNAPYITYGFDPAFISYFGTNGIKAVEQAMEILNNLPKASEVNLDDFAFNTSRPNPKAAALGLIDLKSYVLAQMMFQMGLAEPEEYVHTLRDHTDNPGNTFTWYVIKRNFDPVTLTPTSYINGELWTYDTIFHSSAPHISFPENHPVNPFATGTTIAGGNRRFNYGVFYTGLTYDDMGGLKYIYATNNLNTERLMPGVFEIFTNKTTPRQLDTLDLALLTQRSQHTTNDVETLLGFPGYANLHIVHTNSYLTNLVTTNITSYFTNFPYALGAPLQQAFFTNYLTNVTTAFDYSFDNIITNTVYFRMVVTQQVEVVPSPVYQPGLGSLVTNVTVLSTNFEVGGDFYILPIDNVPVPRGVTNSNIGFDLISTQMQSVVTTTNRVFTVLSANVAVTNTNAVPIQLNTFDLGAFYQQIHWTTNDPAAVLDLYPDLRITGFRSHFTNQILTNIYTFFTNYPSPIPPGPLQVFGTNYETNVVLVYDYDVGNVVINGSGNHFTNFFGWDENFPANPPSYIGGINQFPNVTWQNVLVRRLDLVPAPGYSPGASTVQTNVLEESIELRPIPSGDFFIVSSNYLGYMTNALVLTGTGTATNIDFYAPAQLMTNELDENQSLSTLDLTTFIEQSRTNSPAELLAIYNDLLITSVSNYLTPVTITNYTTYLTNAPYGVPGDPPIVVSNASYTYGVQTNWVYTFGNVVTNTYFTSGRVTFRQDVTLPDPYDWAGSPPQTETITYNFTSNFVNGTIYIVPTNLFGYRIVGGNPFPNVFPVTNVLSSATNTFATNVDQTVIIRYSTNYIYYAHPVQILTTNDFATNVFGVRREVTWNVVTNVYDVYPIELVTTNELASNTLSRTEIVTFYTNMTLGYYPITLRQPDGAGLRPGVDKLTFIRMYNQTGFTTNFYPFTTNYLDTYYTTDGATNVVRKQRVLARTVFRPDILFIGSDPGSIQNVPVANQGLGGWSTAAANWENNGDLNGTFPGGGTSLDFPGPGVIPGPNYDGTLPPVTIELTKVAPMTINDSEGFTGEAYLGQPDNIFFNGQFFNLLNGELITGIPLAFAWGSFDGSTNDPIVYPAGTSFTELENLLLTPPSP